MVALFAITFPLTSQGALPDPDKLEREADDLEDQANRSQNFTEKRRLLNLATEKRSQAVKVRNQILDKELDKPYDAATFEFQFSSLQSTWQSETLARNKNIGANEINTLLSANGFYQSTIASANGAGINPNLLNNNVVAYSDPQGNSRSAFPVKFQYMNKERSFAVEVNYLDFRVRPSYTTIDTSPSVPAGSALQFHTPEYRRRDYSLNLAWYITSGSGAKIGPSVGIRNLDIFSREYGNLPGNYGFGSLEEKAGGLGPQLGFRIIKNFASNLVGHFRADYFRTLGRFARTTHGTVTGLGGTPYILSTEPSGGIKDNLLSRVGYEVDFGISLLRTRWLKFTLGFQYTELVSKVSGYNYNPTVFPNSPGDLLFMNTLSKPLDQTATQSALSKEVHDKFYGIYIGASLIL
ncbi:hypothetical protein CH373_13365 [Leptospira perolatii]|uniref:Uncharacterized protein n=2 Tax=Leptospira perolatii TaxID=2023191 RepID=A0A2M9ZL90_9LEPT|nr:hypothetical protein CH360_08320 [Leptospira perolatii]PJZ72741.1 hypothetical protein CH373_13365 [Leptospira perolatii]